MQLIPGSSSNSIVLDISLQSNPSLGQVAQWLAHMIVLLMMKIVGGSNPTVSSRVGLERVEAVLARGDPGWMSETSALGTGLTLQHMGPHLMHTHTWALNIMGKQTWESDEEDPRGTCIRKTI
jgi:hypothetical protein